MSKITLCVFIALAETAGAHVLDEATYFWRFDRDVNGLTNGPYWVTDTVPQPARGISTRRPYLHFPIQNVLTTNATSGVVTSNS